MNINDSPHMEVKAWVEIVSIPTYTAGVPEKNPMFLEKRVYQGSSGVVYPHPVIEHISDEKVATNYTAVFLENQYLKIMILPELGGRVQRAYDKVRKRDFIYYNQVIKPALVGLAGPWISGGIEFNWPQHHRPSTFSPVDYKIEENEDGSITVWTHELEIMFRTKGMAGFTLHPGKAYLEIKGKLFNRTAFPQTFLWWANPAVKVNEHYQSIFPPDVHAVFDHGKRDVSDFPIATGTYYKVDYAPGTDISRYDTIPVPTSYMAIHSKYDFMGCYEHDTKAGMLHVADHNVSPGKKQWTWGNGEFGFAWDRNLTDEDGPYIELMTGVFTDNQPDFSWLQPNEGKRFEQYFMPYALIGHVKNATMNAMVNIECLGNKLFVKVYATALYPNATISIYKDGELLKEYTRTISPEHIFEEELSITVGKDATSYSIRVKDSDGSVLVSYEPEKKVDKEIPEAALPALAPSEIDQVEELFLNGLHLEQYRHATFNPMDYYEEGLRRSPNDIRCNNAIGLLLLRRGQFAKAETFFKTSIKTLTSRNPNPYDGEPHYNLGCCLMLQGKLEEAYESFFKATWNDAWKHSSFLMLARIACALSYKGEKALDLVEQSLVYNDHSSTLRHLKAALLRRLSRHETFNEFVEQSLKIDPFNYGVHFEKALLQKSLGETESFNYLKQLMRGAEQNYLELSLDYAAAGMFAEGIQVLELLIDQENISAMPFYYLGWMHLQSTIKARAEQYFEKAAAYPAAYCFPNRIEEIIILEAALKSNPNDGHANYYLGNLWYDKRQYDNAISCWEKAVDKQPSFPTSYRNLSLAYFNKRKDKIKSLSFLEKAFSLDKSDARILMELDQLYKVLGNSPEQRLSFLEEYSALVDSRDDLYLERVTLLNTLSRFDEAKKALASRRFHPWEGGEGKVVSQYLYSHLELAKIAIEEGRFGDAQDLLTQALTYPDNLGEGKLYGAPENDIHYLLGCTYEGIGMVQEARVYFMKATIGKSEPSQAIYYNDPQPDKIIYQAWAWNKLNMPDKARAIFRKFIEFGEEHMNDEVHIDYFAVSLPDMLVFDIDLKERNSVHCKYLVALGQLGCGEETEGSKLLEDILQKDANHQGAASFISMIGYFRLKNTIQL